MTVTYQEEVKLYSQNCLKKKQNYYIEKYEKILSEVRKKCLNNMNWKVRTPLNGFKKFLLMEAYFLKTLSNVELRKSSRSPALFIHSRKELLCA